ncbi:MAG: glycosyltransferase family 1 protein [candidate division Zixibacteria bacterium]|nr:glycosyltransferase family 1 protein [candidate division Zixibacteria bacterium]
MITVAYDVTSLAENPYGGIAQVCRHTLEQAGRCEHIRACALYRRGTPSNLDIPGVDARKIGWRDRLGLIRYDIVHALGHRVPPSRCRKLVYTLHDAWSLYPNPYQGADFQRRVGARMRAEIERADAIVCDSQATLEKLLELQLVEPTRCHVVPCGVSEPGQPATKADEATVAGLLSTNFVLFVGRIEVRKNLEHVVDALLPIIDLHLVVVGENGHRGEQIRLQTLSRMPTERLHVLSRISESNLDLLYRKAVATLQPSWEEGFGLPVMEAMIRGCPVVTSNCSATKEVSEGAAILVDPTEPSQSRAAIERLRCNRVWQAEIVSKGIARARAFSWEKSFGKLLAVYRSLIPGS